MKGDLDFVRRAIQLPIIEPLDEYRLSKFITIASNSLQTALNYVQVAMNSDEIQTNDQILHDITRICIKLGDIIRCSPRLENSRHVFLNYHLLLAVTLTKGLQQILRSLTSQQSNENQQQAKLYVH